MDIKDLELERRLPKLPGYAFGLAKYELPNNRKSHAFDYSNGVPVCNAMAPGIGGVPLYGQKEAVIHTSVEIYPQNKEKTVNVPAWVAFDRKVLRFYAYFQESVQERREEHYRIRKVSIYFYLEDDTIHVSEPRINNSGIPQGTMIRRHRISKPDSATGQHFTVADFNVGEEVSFYGRTFKIVGCDAFTRTFLSQLSITVPQNQEFPQDPFTENQNELNARIKAKRPYKPHYALRQFLENDRKVLRFYCVWDDSNNAFGDAHPMIIHYFLSDDTIEIREQIINPSKVKSPEEEHVPPHSVLFLNRCRLPKRPFSRSGVSSPDDYYTDKDFIIGTVIHLYGRPFIICDCDEFTKQHYVEKYGLETFDPINFEDLRRQPNDHDGHVRPEPKELQDAKKSMVGMIGQSVQAPKPHFKEIIKYDGVVLRYAARLCANDAYNKERKFVISLFMADQSICVFEQAKPNASTGGKFLEKGRIRKFPGTEFHSSKDFKIGAKLHFYNHTFDIVDADEYAKKFMAEHPDLFAH